MHYAWFSLNISVCMVLYAWLFESIVYFSVCMVLSENFCLNVWFFMHGSVGIFLSECMVLYAWFCRNISVYMIVLAQFCPPDYGSVYLIMVQST